MNCLKFKPEGWNHEITEVTSQNIDNYIDTNQVLQGLVQECDDNYNLHIQFENGLTGIMPRQEVEAITTDENGLPKANLCTGKVHKFVQFKIKETKDSNQVIVSRKEVQEEALEWIKNDLKEGQKLIGIVKNIKPYGALLLKLEEELWDLPISKICQLQE